MKKLLALTASVMVALSLSACGGPEEVAPTETIEVYDAEVFDSCMDRVTPEYQELVNAGELTGEEATADAMSDCGWEDLSQEQRRAVIELNQ